jgi:GT2 family glycosyltransferase
MALFRAQDSTDRYSKEGKLQVILLLRAAFKRMPTWSKPLIRYIAGVPFRGLRLIRIRILGITDYGHWIRNFDALSKLDRRKIRSRIGRLPTRPLISVVMPVFETPAPLLRKAIESVRNQIYPHWELCIADDASASLHVRKILDSYAHADSRIKCVYRETNGHVSAASNSALALAEGEYVAFLDHDGALADHALYMVAEAVLQNRDADIFYSDEDKLDARGKRFDPHFKPDWSPELFYGQNYLNHLTAYKRAAIERVGGFRAGYEGSQDYDLALRVIASTKGPIVHIPYILYHDHAATMSSANLGQATAAARRALVEHFASFGKSVEIEDVMAAFHHVVRPDPVSWPRISVVIPTRDFPDILQAAIDGLLTQTDYPGLEIIIADNDSCEPGTLAYFAEVGKRGIKVVRCPGPFNYSDINNRAIAQSSGELVLLLNNDVSMIDPRWLKEMARYFSDPTIGIVGAKLLYPDGTLQHAGVVLGIGGVAEHRYLGSPGSEKGAFGRLALPQDVSCVTAACLLIRRSVFDQVGGLDRDNLPVAFNDVDLCLRVKESGYRIIWTPYAVLHHHESKSRGSDQTAEKKRRFQREVNFMTAKWGEKLLSDPFFNPNLSLRTFMPQLAFPPRVRKPWLTDPPPPN